MSAINKTALSIRKRPTAESIIPANGGKILCFQHQATGGETSINFNALVVPPSLTGFSNPSLSDLLGAHVSVYPASMTLMSSLNGVLQKDVTWQMTTPQLITLNSYTLTAGEIITGIIHATAYNGVLVTDARAIVASGTLTTGQDTIVTDPFTVNKYSTTQIGAVLVYLNGQLQMRNVNNVTAAPAADGNYQELPVAGGLTNQIKLNSPVGSDTTYIVVSNGLVAERPSGSMLAAIEALQGKVDAMIPDLEQVTGNPAGTYGVAPSNVDLQAFGNQVLDHENRIDAIELTLSEIVAYSGNGYGSSNTLIRRYTNVTDNSNGDWSYADSATLGATFTCNRRGTYVVARMDYHSAAVYAIGISKNGDPTASVITGPSMTIDKLVLYHEFSTANNIGQVSAPFTAIPGDVIRAHDHTGVLSNATQPLRSWIRIIRVR